MMAFGKPRTWKCGNPEHTFVVNEVRLSGLQPGKKVYYMASNNRNSTEWSAEKFFISPKLPTDQFHFYIYGDTGNHIFIANVSRNEWI